MPRPPRPTPRPPSTFEIWLPEFLAWAVAEVSRNLDRQVAFDVEQARAIKRTAAADRQRRSRARRKLESVWRLRRLVAERAEKQSAAEALKRKRAREARAAACLLAERNRKRREVYRLRRERARAEPAPIPSSSPRGKRKRPPRPGRNWAATVSGERLRSVVARDPLTDGERRLLAQRPTTRADCEPGGRNEARPCPWVGCRHHVAIKIAPSTGGLKVMRGWDEPDGQPTCSLDAAAEGPRFLEQVGDVLGTARERVREIEYLARGKMLTGLAAAGVDVGDMLDAHEYGDDYEAPEGET